MDDTEAFNDFIANNADDLFADDEEDYENVETGKRDDTYIDTLINKKKAAKLGIFSTSNFWVKNEKNDIKNYLWDFMIYNNIRESSINNYKNNIELLNNRLMLNIVTTKNSIIKQYYSSNNETSEINREKSGETDIETYADNYIKSILSTLNIKISNYNPNGSEKVNRQELKKDVNYKFMKNNIFIRRLIKNVLVYRKTRDEMVKGVLLALLKSFNEFRNKILDENFNENKKIDLTRFLKNLDKISSRFEFFAEYRFHNILTYMKNKQGLDDYVQNSYLAPASGSGSGVKGYGEFVNGYNPNLAPMEDHTSTTEFTERTEEPNKSEFETATEKEKGNIFDLTYSTGEGDKEVITLDSSGNEDKSGDDTTELGRDLENNLTINVEQTKPNEDVEMEDEKQKEEDLKLLMDARKKASEILKMKRLQRMES